MLKLGEKGRVGVPLGKDHSESSGGPLNASLHLLLDVRQVDPTHQMLNFDNHRFFFLILIPQKTWVERDLELENLESSKGKFIDGGRSIGDNVRMSPKGRVQKKKT